MSRREFEQTVQVDTVACVASASATKGARRVEMGRNGREAPGAGRNGSQYGHFRDIQGMTR